MKTKVTEQGVLIPREMLDDAEEVDIRHEEGIIIIVPIVTPDPIYELGKSPVSDDIEDASENHDKYLYGNGE